MSILDPGFDGELEMSTISDRFLMESSNKGYHKEFENEIRGIRILKDHTYNPKEIADIIKAQHPNYVVEYDDHTVYVTKRFVLPKHHYLNTKLTIYIYGSSRYIATEQVPVNSMSLPTGRIFYLDYGHT